jgi:hypothetical protein
MYILCNIVEKKIVSTLNLLGHNRNWWEHWLITGALTIVVKNKIVLVAHILDMLFLEGVHTNIHKLFLYILYYTYVGMLLLRISVHSHM